MVGIALGVDEGIAVGVGEGVAVGVATGVGDVGAVLGVRAGAGA